MHNEGEVPRDRTAPDPAPSSSGLLHDFGALGRALKRMFGAQLGLLSAELGLARSAISWMLIGGLAATVAGVGMGLTMLGFIGVALAAWWGSWLWALVALFFLQAIFLAGAILLVKRCMHWMTLPATRGELSAMMRDAAGKPSVQFGGEDQQ
jgi:hypothetical protein